MKNLVTSLIRKNNSKIVLIVLDGLGGLPSEEGKTELEIAKTPNLDNLAYRSALGLHIPVDWGITPGSGPGHLALFGYDPLQYQIGRGVLETLGLGIEIGERDIAVRGNYATVESKEGKLLIKDRRAGRIPTEENRRISAKLQENIRRIEDVEVIVAPGLEHRVAVVFRFPQALPVGSDEINDTDPQKTDTEPLTPKGRNPQAERVARIVRKFLRRAEEILKEEKKANYLLLRGFSQKPKIPCMEELFGLKSLCIAFYPMYRGIASLVGMKVLKPAGNSVKETIYTLHEVWEDYDFFFLHIKKTDSYGEDGNPKGKAGVIEEFDKTLPKILDLKPDVLAITGDHSTPSVLKGHSWHPVPLLINSPYVLGRTSRRFTERECLKGEIGLIPTKKIMNLLLAHALRLKKFGA